MHDTFENQVYSIAVLASLKSLTQATILLPAQVTQPQYWSLWEKIKLGKIGTGYRLVSRLLLIEMVFPMTNFVELAES